MGEPFFLRICTQILSKWVPKRIVIAIDVLAVTLTVDIVHVPDVIWGVIGSTLAHVRLQ